MYIFFFLNGSFCTLNRLQLAQEKSTFERVRQWMLHHKSNTVAVADVGSITLPQKIFEKKKKYSIPISDAKSKLANEIEDSISCMRSHNWGSNFTSLIQYIKHFSPAPHHSMKHLSDL